MHKFNILKEKIKAEKTESAERNLFLKMDKNEYKKMAEDRSKRSKCFLNTVKAFISGGLICVAGQLFFEFYSYLGIPEDTSKALESVTLIFIAGLLTGLGVFGRIAKHTGAGTLVPITGFSNAVTSPAIESKSEGFITGVAAKMFVIAGPVIVYGTLASALYGVIYYFVTI